MRELSYGLAGIMLAASALLPATAYASDTPSKNVWALLTGQLDNQSPEIGIVNYDLAAPQTFTMVQENTSGNSLGAAVMVDGVFYWYEYTQQIYGYDAVGLYAYDTEDGSTRLVASYGGERNGVTFSSPTYDYQTETVYALGGLMGGGALVTVDLETGVVNKVADFSGMVPNEEYASEDFMKAIAMNYDGDMYGISYWGRLYKINPVSAGCTLIADLDFNPEKAIMYHTTLAFDNDTNELYWSVYTWVNLYKELRKINIADATTERVGIFGDNRLIDDFYIPFTVAEASAPAKVSGLTVTPGKEGALTAQISWTNPSKTYGRGGTLEELLKIEVYRNNELIQTFDNPEIGGRMSFTDNLPENALYSYKVVGYNTAGKGDRSSVSMFVGHGVPMEVTDLTLVPDNHGAKLTWEAPKSGKFDSYLDLANLTYEIVRSDGVTVAADCKETEYTDNSIETLGRYCYTVKAKCVGGESLEVTSNDAVCGPAVTVPTTFGFASQAEFNLWTVIDGNGNGISWSYAGWPMAGARCAYASWDNYAAHDYFISPKIDMKAGQHYKVTFDAMPNNKNITEIIAVSFGTEPTPERQDSVTQFEFRSNGIKTLRAELPVVNTDGEYNFGFVYRSYEVNYNLTIGNIRIEENHDGCVEGIVSCDGKPVADAEIIVNGGQYVAKSDEKGKYLLEYLPEGSYTASVSALGFADTSVEVNVEELTTVSRNIDMAALPAYKLSGKVEDAAGDPVENANVAIGGYNTYNATTSADGSFEIDGVYEKDAYSITVTRNNLLSYSNQFDMSADLDLGVITLDDNLKAPRSVSVEDKNSVAEVAWTKPLNDPMEFRYDDGGFARSLGISSGTSASIFGHVNRTPSVLYGTSFLIMSTAAVPNHYSVYVYVMDLDENGEPTDNVLYKNTYVPVTDDEWTQFTFPAPIDCPNGYMVGVAYSGFVSLAIDGEGDRENYPFVQGVNCYTGDYTTGKWYYLDDTDYKANFAIRSIAAPYEISAPQHKVFSHKVAAPAVIPSAQDALNKNIPSEPIKPMKAVEDRVRYNVYRAVNSENADAMEWKELASNLKERVFSDEEWSSMPQGVYRYGVKAVYAGGETSPIAIADSIGKDMTTDVTLRFKTDTPENESEGTAVSIYTEGGKFNYSMDIDANGEVHFDNVWKGIYTMIAAKDGFVTLSETIDLSTDSSYDYSFIINEDRRQPENLQVLQETEADNQRLLVWNFPNLLFDGFEDHPDFEVNSEGNLGWQYIDADGLATGGFSTYTWPNAFEPMAWMVFNPKATEPALEDYNLLPYEGEKLLTSFASYGDANDDWIISPRLYFTEEFLFNFYFRSYSYMSPETIQVGYSLTGTEPEDFIMVEEALNGQSYWIEYSYSIPTDAKYVAIRNVTNQHYIAMLDNLRIGTPDMIASNVRIPETVFRGVYEVFLDGEKVGETKDTNWLLSGLSSGKHIAGVRGSYKSGYSETTYTPFEIVTTGVESVGNPFKVTVDGGKLVINGNYDSAELYPVSGLVIVIDRDKSAIDLSSLGKGVYILSVNINGKKITQKVTI